MTIFPCITKTSRSYNQYCPLAKALDILGERWTLLIVRELLSGPKRFKDLQEALAGIGANLLSTRLKEMERNGLVLKGVLPPPGVASVYDLTEHGRALKEPLLALVKWGLPLIAEPRKPDELFVPHWLIHRLMIVFKPEEAEGVAQTYEFRVDGEVFHMRVENGQASGDVGPGYSPDLVWESDSETIKQLIALRTLTPEQSMEKGHVKAGSLENLRRVLRMFDPTRI